MTQKYYSLTTNSGIEYINSQVLINPNKIMADGWYIKLGNGETEPSADMTDLSNVIYTKTAEDYPQITFGRNNDGHYAEILLPESLSGEIITEAGLYNQNDVLIAVAKIYIDLSQSGDGLEMSVKQRIYLSAVPASVSVIYTAQADLITEDRLAEELSELSDTINNNINNVSNIKQDKLTEGYNIDINSNVISASGKYPYSFNNGNVDSSGNADLISYSGADVSYKVGGTYPNLTGTKADGQQFEVDAIADDNVSTLADGNYIKYIGSDDTTDLLKNKITVAKVAPSTPSADDVWINNAVSPLSVKKYVSPNYTNNDVSISSDGIASNFENGNVLNTDTFSLTSGNTFSLEGTFNSAGNKTNFCTILTMFDTVNNVDKIQFGADNNSQKLMFRYPTSATTSSSAVYNLGNITYNETHVFKIDYDGTALILYVDNVSIYSVNVDSSYFASTYRIEIGNDSYRSLAQPFYGSIDLKEFKIYVDDVLVYQPNVLNNGWVDYDKVPLGKITVSSGAVTGVESYPYNIDYISNNIVKSYRSGNTGYQIYADGYCVQWGRINGANSGTITLKVPYSSTAYNIQITPRREDSTHNITAYVVGDRTNSGFGWFATADYTAGMDWKTTGYIDLYDKD